MTREEIDWSDRDAVAEHLLAVAVRLTWMVRDVDPAETRRFLESRVPPREMWALVTVMAALVDDTKTITELLAWREDFTCRDLQWKHRQYRKYRDEGVDIDDMPYGVVRAEQMWKERRAKNLAEREARRAPRLAVAA